MTTLEQEFLADLEDELEDLENDLEEKEEKTEAPSEDSSVFLPPPSFIPDKKRKREESDEPTANITDANMGGQSLSNVLAFSKSSRFLRHMDQIEKSLQHMQNKDHIDADEEGENYLLMVESNTLLLELSEQILKLHRFVRDIYIKRFPELESLVLDPMQYLKSVIRLCEAPVQAKVDLSDLLPAATAMIVTVAASTAVDKQLSSTELDEVKQACEAAFYLENCKDKMLQQIEGNMNHMCPNISAIVGCGIAARLVGEAGGIHRLSAMPSSVVQILGANKKSLAGFSSAKEFQQVGYIHECDLIRDCPHSVRKKIIRMLAAKLTLAARMDAFKESPDGANGQGLREEIAKKIDKLQQPPPAKQVKALPVPDPPKPKKRGGKRYRKQKEKYAISELQKHANRLVFGPEAEEEVGMEGQKGFGMIGMANKLRLQASDRKLTKKHKKKDKGGGVSTVHRTGVQTSGLHSSLAFTPVQGIELVDPALMQKRVNEANMKYFSDTIGFVGVKKKSE